jgi:hypothetical protein
MQRTVEEVGIAEGDVLRTCVHLLPDVGEYHVTLHDAKDAAIDRRDGAVPTQVFAAAARLGVADDAVLA